MDVRNIVRYLCVLVLHHQMRVSNYFVNSFYSVGDMDIWTGGSTCYFEVKGDFCGFVAA